jgi:uncharacterized membrane protein YphA (DoxX/SURF4 family)
MFSPVRRDEFMTRSTAVFLVLLRLAIGWHFLVEGWVKIRATDLIGPAASSKPFNSEGYFRESHGPLAGLIRQGTGDPDEELLARLTVQPMPKGQEPARYPDQNRTPPALARDWDDYFARFTAHYNLDETQKRLAEGKLQQAKHNTVHWLNTGEMKVTRTFSTANVDRTLSMPERIAEYRAKVKELHDAFAKKLPKFSRDVEQKNLGVLKAEVSRLRAGLVADLDTQTAEMKKTLDDVLTDEQRKLGAVPAEGAGPSAEYVQRVRGAIRGHWMMDPGPDSEPPVSWMEVLNALTRWGLFLIGAGLLLGLFTRFWCVLGAGFLLMTYLTAPPFPWLPAAPQTEGTYLFVNKNVIEMLALCVLATTFSGRWFGLDALLHGVFTGFRVDPSAKD